MSRKIDVIQFNILILNQYINNDIVSKHHNFKVQPMNQFTCICPE